MNDQVTIEAVIAVNQEYKPKNPPPVVSADDGIKTNGILHFTLGVRDQIAAAKFCGLVRPRLARRDADQSTKMLGEGVKTASSATRLNIASKNEFTVRSR